jgi:hypothetical protein
LVALDTFQEDLPKDQKRLVFISAILPSPQTIGLQELAHKIVMSINGMPIHGLAEVTEAIRHPQNGFQRIDLEGSAGPIFLDAATLGSEESALRSHYGIPSKDNH